MREALQRVKRELGENAVILGTRSDSAGRLGSVLGAARVEITAAPPEAAGSAPRGTGAGPHSGGFVPDNMYPYYRELVQNEVADELAARLARQAAATARADRISDADALRETFRRTIARMIPVVGGVNLTDRGPRRVALVGPAGGGKTTTLAKLAAHFKLRQRKRVTILSLDMHRLGSNEQLRRYADLIGTPMHSAQTIAGVKETMRGMPPTDLVLIDTHGVCAGDRGHFARLAAVLGATRPDEVHLVLPASMLPSVQARMAERFAPLGVSRVVLTHVDETVGLGVVLNAIEKLRWGLSYVTDGETIPNSIAEACAERLAAVISPLGR
jgi:flagellar biosynthesis protein FlhF